MSARVERRHRSREFVALLKDLDTYYAPESVIRLIMVSTLLSPLRMGREGRIVGWMRTTLVFAARQKRWQELIRQQEQSQQPVSAFCRDHDIGDASFYTWRKRLVASQPVRFLLVEPSASGGNQPGSVELILASGDRLRITPGTDAATLRTALSVLRERA